MKISIAMATLNGAKFLQEQLDSFVGQARQPDELVVCDDGSSDETLQILDVFQHEAPFDVHIHRNREILGFSRNFGKALGLCRGDIVFLSDQDDVWLPQKIERVAGLMAADERALVVINDQEITDEKLNPTGLTTAGQNRTAGGSSDMIVYGCCSAVSARLLPFVLPVPQGEVVTHDNLIHKLGRMLDARIVVDDVLQYYRRHDSNTTQGPLSRTSKLTKWDLAALNARQDTRLITAIRLDRIELCINRIREGIQQQAPKTLPRPWLESALDRSRRERSALQARLQILERSRPQRLLLALGSWLRGDYSYFSGWKSLVKDLVDPPGRFPNESG